MNHESLLVAEFLDTPWAMSPDRLAAITEVVYRWGAGVRITPEDLKAYEASAAVVAARRDAARASGGDTLAVLPMYGVLSQRANMARAISGAGATSTQQLTGALRAAVDDPSVRGIVLEIDSPGGSVFGITELADEIFNARAQKPVVAVANSSAASAAYWLGSQASEFYVTPSGEVGSIGVFAAHKDLSAAYEKAGVKTTLISAGPHKTEGNANEPLSEEARAYMQARVDDHYKAFVRAVARGRNASVDTVRSDFGGGRMLNASDAKSTGMVDGVATFDDVVRKLARDTKRKGMTRAAMARREFIG